MWLVLWLDGLDCLFGIVIRLRYSSLVWIVFDMLACLMVYGVGVGLRRVCFCGLRFWVYNGAPWGVVWLLGFGVIVICELCCF